MSNNFDTLTISNNYIFCCVMQDDSVCKELLTMLLQKKIGKPVKLIHQKEINNYIGAKGTRLDIMVQDDSGCLYDVEMQVTSQGMYVRVHSLTASFGKAETSLSLGTTDIRVRTEVCLCTLQKKQAGS